MYMNIHTTNHDFVIELKRKRSEAYKLLNDFIQRSIDSDIQGDIEFAERWRWIAEEQARYIKVLSEDIVTFDTGF